MIDTGLNRSILAPGRLNRAELIDATDVSGDDLERSFSDIRKINRFLGGIAVVRRELDRLVSPSESSSLLDLGTGTADIPLYLIKRARSQGGCIRATVLDANDKIAHLARQQSSGDPDIRVVTGDASALPFADQSFDFVTCSLTFHHFSDAVAIKTLREMNRVARVALIVNDLQRGYLPAGLIWLVTRLTMMHRLTRHDAPLSVMRSRTLAEYSDLAALAGFSNAEVRRHPFWRASLVVSKGVA